MLNLCSGLERSDEKAIDRKGNLYGVCQGSGWSYEREYYRALEWNFNDTHGIGIVMLAGVETDRLKHYLTEEWLGGNYDGNWEQAWLAYELNRKSKR